MLLPQDAPLLRARTRCGGLTAAGRLEGRCGKRKSVYSEEGVPRPENPGAGLTSFEPLGGRILASGPLSFGKLAGRSKQQPSQVSEGFRIPRTNGQQKQHYLSSPKPGPAGSSPNERFTCPEPPWPGPPSPGADVRAVSCHALACQNSVTLRL